MGVSVESQQYTYRINALRQVPVTVRFLSCEPLLGSLSLDLREIDWVIVGGESGYQHRPIKPEWVREILRQTREADAAFFFKQWGGTHSKAGGRLLDDRIWDEMPEIWVEHISKWQKQKVSRQQNLNRLEQKHRTAIPNSERVYAISADQDSSKRLNLNEISRVPASKNFEF